MTMMGRAGEPLLTDAFPLRNATITEESMLSLRGEPGVRK